MSFTDRVPRKPPKAKEITFTLPEGVLTFRKKDMSGHGGGKARNALLIDRKPVPILAGPAAPLEGILAALLDSPSGVVVRHALEKGSVRWAPTPEAMPRLSTKETRDPYIANTTATRDIYGRIAAALVAEIDEPKLMAYIQEEALRDAISPDIIQRNYTPLSPNPTPKLASVLGRFNGFSHLRTEQLYPWLGYSEGERAMSAAELQDDVNWCRVIQDLEDTRAEAAFHPNPVLSFYPRYEGPALAPCWVRAQYRAATSAVEAAALALCIPALADVKVKLPTLVFSVAALHGVPSLRWICADGLTVVSDNGAIHQQVAAPLRLANHDDVEQSFVGDHREAYRALVQDLDPVALHPVSLGALPAYLHASAEAYAHALLDVACSDSDPGQLMSHLGAPIEERYWRAYPIVEATFRAALIAAAGAEGHMPEAIAGRIVATAARLAHLANTELAPLLSSARQFGLSEAALAELDHMERELRVIASRASVTRLLDSHEERD